jgi:hypothetical protein
MFEKKISLEELIENLNEKYKGTLSVYGLLKQEKPIIKNIGRFQVPEYLEQHYKQRKGFLENISNYENGMNHNEPHLVLEKEFQFGPYLELDCLLTDYAACQTMRIDGNEEFQLITGNALVWCPKTKQVVFQIRGTKDVDCFPGASTIFGGGFLPLNFNDKASDESIFDNIDREFGEETGGKFHLQKLDSYPILVTKEHLVGGRQKTGSIQFNSLGVEIPKDAIKKLRPTWEGGIDYINKNNLVSNFEKKEWTPFAVASILVWLNQSDRDQGLFKKLYNIFTEKSFEDLLGLSGKALDIYIKTQKIT